MLRGKFDNKTLTLIVFTSVIFCASCTHGDLTNNDLTNKNLSNNRSEFTDARTFTDFVVHDLTKNTYFDSSLGFFATQSSRRVYWSPELQRSIADTRPFLNLLGDTEGTDKGDNYNETLAYGSFTDGDVVLTNMTLAEVDRLQTRMLSHKANSLNSSAVGRYQIVRTTMRGLKERLELSDDQKFSAELQDRLALALLKQRGLDAWRRGNLRDEEFALNLSKEWASLPRPNSCHGYYSDQKAAVCFNEVKTVLGMLREN